MHGIIRSALLFSLLTYLTAQSWYHHPELDWYTIETDHFIVHYHDDTRRSAQEAAVVAERIYGPLTELYQYEPDSKTHLIIQDTDDYSNGGAYYYDNKILLWAMPLDFDLRGSHRWMQNVLTHEFTHIIQLGASMKYPRSIPAAYLQILNYEDEARDDVLYGYPNTIVSYPMPGTVIPMWFAEGTAQSMFPGADFDYWDSHRDMILRDRILNNKMLEFREMNSFGKRGIGNEEVYNHGFAFVLYLTERFGADVRRKITAEFRKPFQYSVNQALKGATGIDGRELYDDWVEHLRASYSQRIGKVQQNPVQGIVLENGGTTNVHPVWSPSQQQFAFLSNRQHDYFSQTDLFVYDFQDSKSRKLMGDVQTQPCWLNDSTLVYAKRNQMNRHGSRYFDLYRLNLNSEEEERLTEDSRLISPSFNPDSNLLAAITTYDGTSNIMVSAIDSIDFKPLTHQDNGMHMISLTWAGENLLVDAVIHQQRSIYQVDADGNLIELTDPQFDSRDMTGTRNNLVTADNRSGVFNLHLQSPEGDGFITNVTGGAFMPDLGSDGRILYSLYLDGSYNIAVLDPQPSFIPDTQVGYSEDYFQNYPLSELYDFGQRLPERPYEDTMPRPFILPRLMWDYETLKPGAYMFANDVLDKLFVFGGASMNKLGDKDIFLMFEFSKWAPTIYTNFFWLTRNVNEFSGHDSTLHYDYVDDLSFRYFMADIGMRFPYKIHKFWLEYSYTQYIQNVDRHDIVSITGQSASEFGISFDVFHGHAVKARWQMRAIKPQFAGHMLPSNGFEIEGQLGYEWNSFFDSLKVNEKYSTLESGLSPNHTARLSLDGTKHFTLNHDRKIVGTVRSRAETMFNEDVDDYFYYFGGGLPGIRGYSFYDSTMSGTSLWINTGTVRLPVFLEKSFGWGPFMLQHMSVGLTGQFGGGFNGSVIDWIDNQDYKLSSGMEMRLSGYSFYGYPTALAYEYHIPLADDIEKKGRHYLTLLFDFYRP